MATKVAPIRGRAYQPTDLFDMLEVADCWRFVGNNKPGPTGYVQLNWRCLPDPYVHRAVWKMLVGPIPEDMTIDHLCRVKHCCNPDHMQVVTPGENTRRAHAGKCRKGHPMTPESTVSNGARRLCKECRRDYRRARRAADRR
jgi:HNH endonuclease